LPAPATARRPPWPRPFKPKDAELFGIISSFDGAYSAYNGYQAGMERFWTLYLEQNGITELTASVFKEGPNGSFLVRADNLPLVLPVLGAQNLPRGAHARQAGRDRRDLAGHLGHADRAPGCRAQAESEGRTAARTMTTPWPAPSPLQWT
jgi:exoribonuclease-2